MNAPNTSARRQKQIKDPPPKTKRIRCAVYTRKSTSEGLDMEFSSLDAQREAGENYIKSQLHEGWECLPERYDDGGFTGSNLERPALQRLLRDIEDGKVDCIAVYKVDRLSRSLLDFGKLMEKFDEHQVAFVSVTQAFNTASSMGRLVLNVLLSFAQFEREIISERTRDKIAATRRKGKWSGGMPVLGYAVVDTKLVVDPVEKDRVREIFDLYLEHKSLLKVVKLLNKRGWCTKQWTTRTGSVRGGRPFTKSKLRNLLTNVVYIGKVRYKSEVHAGEQRPILDERLFNKALAILKQNALAGAKVRNKHGALLRGILRCGSCDCAMSHSFTRRKNKSYRYYVCTHAQQHGWQSCPAPSVPAGEIERFVVEQIREIGRDPEVTKKTLAEVRRQLETQIARLRSERRGMCDRLRTDHAILGDLAATARPGDPRLADANDRIRQAERRLGAIDDELVALERDVVDENEVAAALREFDGVWEALAPRDQARIVELLVAGVRYDGKAGKVSITFRPGGIRELAEELEEAVA